MGSDKQSFFKWYWNILKDFLDFRLNFHYYMGLRRFQIIYKLFTVISSSVERSDEFHDLLKNRIVGRKYITGAPPKHPYWEKVESLIIHIREICQRVYISGTHLCIDEVMLTYRDRSKHITKFKNKLIKEDYKNWILAEHDYIWN
jgi:hypothetical protein